MKRLCTASDLVAGDEIVMGNYKMLIRSIQGPDNFGTYDVSGIDETGKEHYEPIYGIVSISA